MGGAAGGRGWMSGRGCWWVWVDEWAGLLVGVVDECGTADKWVRGLWIMVGL